jgi:hypothetical protein
MDGARRIGDPQNIHPERVIGFSDIFDIVNQSAIPPDIYFA